MPEGPVVGALRCMVIRTGDRQPGHRRTIASLGEVGGLTRAMTMKRICIVSCTAHKRGKPMPAEHLYSSHLFFRSRRYAQANYDGWLILSAKHGLVDPSRRIAPYDCKLTMLPAAERSALARRVSRQASDMFGAQNVQFTSLCGKAYDQVLREAGLTVHRIPEFMLPIGMKLRALGEYTNIDKRDKLLNTTYDILADLSRRTGLRRLSEVIDDEMPARGVYLFWDDEERRLTDIDRLRIVRVGTHGVALGSKASLRDRMRTHFGTLGGGGNHRSSVFRLHVGCSLMNAGLVPVVPSWGRSVRSGEEVLHERVVEREVSRYLSNLRVLVVSVPGGSDKSNDRAYIEQNLIALVSNQCRPLDPPSSLWLGLHSDKIEIRKSGLWNVNHVSQGVDPGFVDALSYYSEMTASDKPVPERQLAPADWQARLRDDVRQFTLL